MPQRPSGPGETVTSEYALSAYPEDDGAPEPCNPIGSYTGEDEIEFLFGEHDGPIDPEAVPETVTVTLGFTLTQL